MWKGGVREYDWWRIVGRGGDFGDKVHAGISLSHTLSSAVRTAEFGHLKYLSLVRYKVPQFNNRVRPFQHLLLNTKASKRYHCS